MRDNKPQTGKKKDRLTELRYEYAGIDLPLSACSGDDCSRREDCFRYTLWMTVAQYRSGDTCVVPQVPNCSSFIPNGRYGKF